MMARTQIRQRRLPALRRHHEGVSPRDAGVLRRCEPREQDKARVREGSRLRRLVLYLLFLTSFGFLGLPKGVLKIQKGSVLEPTRIGYLVLDALWCWPRSRMAIGHRRLSAVADGDRPPPSQRASLPAFLPPPSRRASLPAFLPCPRRAEALAAVADGDRPPPSQRASLPAFLPCLRRAEALAAVADGDRPPPSRRASLPAFLPCLRRAEALAAVADGDRPPPSRRASLPAFLPCPRRAEALAAVATAIGHRRLGARHCLPSCLVLGGQRRWARSRTVIDHRRLGARQPAFLPCPRRAEALAAVADGDRPPPSRRASLPAFLPCPRRAEALGAVATAIGHRRLGARHCLPSCLVLGGQRRWPRSRTAIGHRRLSARHCLPFCLVFGGQRRWPRSRRRSATAVSARVTACLSALSVIDRRRLGASACLSALSSAGRGVGRGRDGDRPPPSRRASACLSALSSAGRGVGRGRGR